MKTIIIAILLILPCLPALNESEYFVVNILGLVYMCFIARISLSVRGKRFMNKLGKEIDKFNEIIYKL